MAICKQQIATRGLSALMALVIAVTSLSIAPTQAQVNSRTFSETGKTVQGSFLDYWQRNGALAQQGLPISGELQEKSDTDGKTYTVQYFERAVFEMHPENKAPYNVLLSLLGVRYYAQRYPNGAPGQTANGTAGSLLFPEMGHRLGGLFLQYWKNNGGLAQQGYLISEEFQERSATDGKLYTVQYFERAVFEYHPENKAPYNVLLSLVGTFQYEARYGAISAPPPANVLTAPQRIELLDAVWRTVRDNYVYTDFRGVDWQATYNEYRAKIAAASTDKDVYNLLSDMITKLDDMHSSFLDPEQVAEDEALRRGDLKLSGIGVLSQKIDDSVRIVYVIPGGPADRAGLLAFDIIGAADGTPLTTSEDAPRLIRGPPGTSVRLTIETPGKPARDVVVVRETVTFAFHAQARRWTGTNIAYVSFPTFSSSGIASEMASEIQRLAAAGPLDGVIIDLRQNGGGLISELNSALALFINGGSAGFDVTRSGRTEYRIRTGRVLAAVQGKPVVVLTSKASVSASERFAAVMQDHGRGTILGTTTAGNTETVYPHDMPYGSRLMLAQATYLRIDGKTSIEDIGVVPDIVVDVPWYQFPADQDPQALAAVKHIQNDK